MVQMPDCRTCKQYEELHTQVLAAANCSLWPWNEIFKGQEVLLRAEIRQHETDKHTIKCVTGEDGND